jgi:hypothetical protein
VSEQTPSIEYLRAAAALQGVHAHDDDLEAARGFLSVLLPSFAVLESLTPDGTVPAGMFVPTERP